jgi:hypothetical protein
MTHYCTVSVVSQWDAELMDSQKKLGELASDVRRIQVAQKELDSNLDTIFAYQMELKSTLEVRTSYFFVFSYSDGLTLLFCFL